MVFQNILFFFLLKSYKLFLHQYITATYEIIILR